MSAAPFKDDFLAGKYAIVTGGNDGIGMYITLAMVGAGAKVAVIARDEKKYHDLVEAHPELADATVFFKADLAAVSETKEAAQSAVGWADGNIHILVNNAGVALLGPLETFDVEQWDTVMAINSRAPLLMAQACINGMIERKAGKIINISSQAAVIGISEHGAYCASKAAMDGLTRVMTVEWSKHNIQCNSIGPTVVMTPMGTRVWGGSNGDAMRDRTPLKRFAEPQEIANMVLYLSSDASNILCGQNILMEGGLTIC